MMAYGMTNADSEPGKRTTETALSQSDDLPSAPVTLPILEDMGTDQMVSVEMLRNKRSKRQALDNAFAERRMAKGMSVPMQAAF